MDTNSPHSTAMGSAHPHTRLVRVPFQGRLLGVGPRGPLHSGLRISESSRWAPPSVHSGTRGSEGPVLVATTGRSA